MCDCCLRWGGKTWHRYKGGYYERTDKSIRPKRTLRLHRAVWEAERGPIPNGHDVHHRDEDKGHNAISNLECLPHGGHRAHHCSLDPIPCKDWASAPLFSLPCAGCGVLVERKRAHAATRCARCHQRLADKRRETDRTCTECGAAFRSRAGTLCSQRCVNLATRGATTRVLPQGRGRA